MEVKKNEGAVYLRWLKEEGVQEYLPEAPGVQPLKAERADISAPAAAHRAHSSTSPFDADAWESLRARAMVCVQCEELAASRQNVVFGAGSTSARLMFVGEAPGQDEDLQGLPFVGAAGQLLTKIIEAIQLDRDSVYIANVLKCRPPQNRQPKPEEITRCQPFLEKQIELIQPKIICALGAFAAQTLLKTDLTISKLRGKFRDYPGPLPQNVKIQVMSTYHPAYLLRNPAEKRAVWTDMKAIRAELDRISAAEHVAV